jgi:hypothetical protein
LLKIGSPQKTKETSKRVEAGQKARVSVDSGMRNSCPYSTKR